MTAYIVVSDDDVTAEPLKLSGWMIELVPARKTVKWRGRRFNVRTVRASGRIL